MVKPITVLDTQWFYTEVFQAPQRHQVFVKMILEISNETHHVQCTIGGESWESCVVLDVLGHGSLNEGPEPLNQPPGEAGPKCPQVRSVIRIP